MRKGYTTGTCAAAATKAAVSMLLYGAELADVDIVTPSGKELQLMIEDASLTADCARCAVRKDGGDDVDATHGALIYSEVRRTESGITIDGGYGVGRVTRKGLDQPVGAAAINHVPREMIASVVRNVVSDAGYQGGIDVIITVPEGKEIAERTFNPRLGIVGGISIIGTSGIVEPMSEQALIDTMRIEMNVHYEAGERTILVVPGNYGKDFSKSYPSLKDEDAVKCSNFVGEMLDHAADKGMDVLLVGNLGKLVKVAGGIMNTHSRNADCRMEIMASCALSNGCDAEIARKVLGCISTDDALDVLDSVDMVESVSRTIAERVEFHMNHRTDGRIRTAAMVFSTEYGLLCKTSLADELIEEIASVRN